MRYILILIFIFSIILSGCATTPETPPPTLTSIPPKEEPDLSVLIIGSSLIYYNDWPKYHFTKFFEVADPPLIVDLGMHYEGGSRLEHMWAVPEIHSKIEDGYDLVILQENQPGSYEKKEAFHEYARKFYAKVHEYGSELVLFMPAPDQNRWDDIGNLVQAHNEIASELDIKVAPVALAWQRLMQEYPEYVLYSEDGRHPNNYSDYLGLCVLYATITGNSPVGIPYPGRLTEEQAVKFQQVAWDVVKEYQQ